MKNDLPPSCPIRSCLTINCESNLQGLMSETGHSQASGLDTEGAGDIQKVLQMLLDDRRKREEEIAAERRQREKEAAAER